MTLGYQPTNHRPDTHFGGSGQERLVGMELHDLGLLWVLGNKILVIVLNSLHEVSETQPMLADHRVACESPLSFEVAITKRISIVRFLVPTQRKRVSK